MSTWEDNQTLVHYGVKGQKWNVRRYTNEDGTLTQEGRDHYGIGSSGNRHPGYNHNQTSSAVEKAARVTNRQEANMKKDEFARWRLERHQKNLDKAKAKGDEKKIAKYESKKKAQGQAIADMEAYKKKVGELAASMQGRTYAHAMARGSTRGQAILEKYLNPFGIVTKVRDKKKYGKYIVYSDMDENAYVADAVTE